MGEKNFIKGFYKEIPTKYGNMYGLSINLEEINKLPVDKYGNVKVTLLKRKEQGKYGDTHYLVEDTYKKSEQSEQDDTDEVLPF